MLKLFLVLVSLAVSILPAASNEVVAVLDFTNPSGQVTALSNYICDDLSIQIAGKGEMSLVERGQLKKIMSEQGFQMSGAVDEATSTKLGKLLGASKIIVGQYYAMGDEFQVMTKTIDVLTGKVIKAEKLKYPKSESTSKLDAQVLNTADPKGSTSPTPVSATATAPQSQEGPLSIKECEPNGLGTICVIGSIKSPVPGRLQINRRTSKFIVDDGTKRVVNRVRVAGSGDENEQIEANIPTEIVVELFGNSANNFALFELRYSFNSKDYFIKATPSISK